MVLKTSIILHLSLGTVCYEYPSRNSSVHIKVNCAFPGNLFSNTTIQGQTANKSPFKAVYPLINADNLMIIICTVVKEICVIVVSNLKYNGRKIA